MTIQRRPTPTISIPIQTTHGHQNHLLFFLISGQGYFTFHYQHTKYTTEMVEENKNKQSQAWVSSKRKKGEVCDIFVHSVFLWTHANIYSHKPLAMLTYLLALVNSGSSKVFLDVSLPQLLSIGQFSRLVCSFHFS